VGAVRKSNNGVTFPMRHGRNLSNPGGFNFLETHKLMNWKKIILLSCAVPCVFLISTATAQMRGHRAPMLASTARMPMHRAPMLNSASRFRTFNRFNDGDFDRDDGFRRFNRFNQIIVFDNFGFPFFPSYYPYPYYPYGYGGYGYQSGYDPYGYGGYGYQGGYGNGSSVVQLQRRLARAGYYHGAIDGIMGPATRRAIRAYEGTHNQRAYGMTDRY
jgi:Putative peptidoglycan binding domain